MNNLREIKVTYSNGDFIYTNMAAHLSDKDILSYFKPGKWFNIGNVSDNMQKVVKCEILK
jgi:hypothetical protein